MRTVLSNLIFVSFLILVAVPSQAQEDVLDNYVRQGLDSNLVIVQKELSLKKALNGLASAKSLYLPNVSFDMTYTTASGGRSIDLPIGDMLNPVYATLNQLTNSMSFPSITNQQINFLPKNYYDARIRTSIPLINTDIKHNKEINKHLSVISQQEIEIYERELVMEIKIAYYNYRSAVDAVAIYQNALSLAQEGKRVHEKLLEVGKGLPAYVIRANAEIAQHEAKIAEAQQQEKNAKYYFNALLKRDKNEDILVEKYTVPIEYPGIPSAAKDREELESLATNVAIQETLVKMNKQVYIPKLNAFLDLGSQAEGMRVNRHSAYYMLGAQLSFPIFSGNRNKLKVQESQLAVAEAQNKLEQAKQQLGLVVDIAQNEVLSTYKNYESTVAQLEAADTYQRLIQRGFAAGVNTYIETVDARTQFINAKLAHNIASYKYLSAWAKYEREAATYPL